MDRELAIDGNKALEELVESVSATHQVVVLTRRGRPVARIHPAPLRDREAAAAAAEWIRNSPKIDTGGLTIKEMIDEGRKY